MEFAIFESLRDVFASPLTTGPVRTQVTIVHVLAVCGLIWLALALSSQVERRLAVPLLARARLESGHAFTLGRVIHYLVALLVFFVGVQLVHLDLGALGWMVSFLSIGIGFGLQNVTSNFVSGLIVVLERPIKPGDFVTVGEFMGIVREIRLRSTTIVTMDNVKIIVPNSEFISKNVINRSFRDERVRLHLPVRLTYGAEPALVREALLAAAAGHPRVLPTPGPDVWLVEFATDALYFELLVWIEEPEDAAPIKSALNYAIHRECQARGLEMPHAQHDVHVKGPLTLQLDGGLASRVPEDAPLGQGGAAAKGAGA